MINDDFVGNIKPEDEPKKFYYKIGDKNYEIAIIIDSDYMCINLSEVNNFSQTYGIKLNLKQIKAKHISFSKILSLLEFRKIVVDNINKKTINITKLSEYIIRFELTKYRVNFGLTKKKISDNEIFKNINFRMEIYEQKILEFEIINKLKHEIDEIKKNCEILNVEIKKLKKENIEKEKEKEINYNNEELLELKQEMKEIKNNIEKLKNEEVKPLWTKKFSFRHEKEKRKKIEILCSRDLNNIISENEEKNCNDIFKEYNSHYKIDNFEEKENSIDKKRERNNNSNNGYDFYRYGNLKKNLTSRKLNMKSLENISEESAKSNSFHDRIQTDYNIKEDENIKYFEKVLINNKILTSKNPHINRINQYNTNTNSLNRNNFRKLIKKTKLKNRTSYSEQKEIHTQSRINSARIHN